MREIRNTRIIRVLLGTPIGRSRCRAVWEDHLELNLKKIGYFDMKCIHVSRDRNWWKAVLNAESNY